MADYHCPARIVQGDANTDVYTNISAWYEDGALVWRGWFETAANAPALHPKGATLVVSGQLPASITLTMVELTDPESRIYEGEFDGRGDPPSTVHPDAPSRGRLLRSIAHWATTRHRPREPV